MMRTPTHYHVPKTGTRSRFQNPTQILRLRIGFGQDEELGSLDEQTKAARPLLAAPLLFLCALSGWL
jgi:hypothetical protein